MQKIIGVLNYYRNIGARCSHALAPLTKVSSNEVKFKWTKIKQKAFNKINLIVAHNTLLTYPDFNRNFKTHTDTRNFN